MTEFLRIRDWDKFYVKADNKKVEVMKWIAVPTKQDGDGYVELVEGDQNGMAHLGAWLMLLQLASKCEPRGTLRRGNGSPHTAASIAAVGHGNPKVVDRAIERLLSIGWLEVWKSSDDLPMNVGRPSDEIPTTVQYNTIQESESPLTQAKDEARQKLKRILSAEGLASGKNQLADWQTMLFETAHVTADNWEYALRWIVERYQANNPAPWAKYHEEYVPFAKQWAKDHPPTKPNNS